MPLRCLALLVACVTAATAQDPLQGLLPPKDGPQRGKVLVLQTGQVLQGEVEARLGGYTIRMTSGSLVIPYDQVRTAGTSLDDAYVRMRDALSRPNANNHLELARWCRKVGLNTRAREQVASALQLEPDRSDARALLLELGPQPQDSPLPSSDAEIVGAARIVSEDGALPVTPAGLSRDRVAEFMRQVQPLLLNSCASAACHGSQSAGGFHLQISGRQNRVDSEANLAAVLSLIDARAPDHSPLVTALRESTGPHADALRGPKSREQLDRLTAWTRLVAAEFNRSPDARHFGQTTGSMAEAGIVPAAFTEAGGATGAPLPRRSEDVDDTFLRRIIAEEQTDAFDPAEFNRRVLGR